MGEMISITNDKATIPGYLVKPAGAARGGVLVIHEAWGLVDQIKSVADRLAACGYVALAPDLLSETEIAKMATTEMQEALFDPERRNDVQTQLRALMTPLQAPEFGEKALANVRACFDYLYELPEVGKKVASWGFCFGGTYSFSLAVAEPRLAIAIPFYGHNNDEPAKLAEIKCPVRAFFGENDERLIAGLDDLKSRMKEAGVDFSAKVYPDCGHAFFNDANRFAYNEAAAKDAWEQVKTLLAANVG